MGNAAKKEVPAQAQPPVAAEKHPILGIGLDPESLVQLNQFWKDEEIVKLGNRSSLEDLIDNPKNYTFSGVFCGDLLRDITPGEVAQVFRIQFPQCPIFFISRDRERFSRAELLKNGFHDALIEPFDKNLLKKIYAELSGISAEDVNRDKFAPIRLIDLPPNAVLDFHVWVYLPVNRKHVQILAAGQKLHAERLERIKDHDVNSVYIIREELPKFYKYSAGRLHDLSKGLNGKYETETEVKERLQGSIRTLFTSIFDEAASSNVSAGKVLLTHCEEIVSTYISENLKNDWYLKVRNAIADGNNPYSHSLTVSTLAALFSIGTGLGKPDELAIAGILHDIGLIEVPAEIVDKPEQERTFEEQKIYANHPALSLKFIKNKKIILSEECVKTIADHHERWDGKGYPRKKFEKNIIPTAQILAMADQFDYLTRVEPGKPYLKAKDAFQKMKASGAFDPNLMDQIFKLLPI